MVSRLFSRFNTGIGIQADFDPSLPSEVRELLALSGSEYEQKRAVRYSLNDRYFKNIPYDKAFLASTDSAALEQQKKGLWSGIRPMFGEVTHAIKTDKRLCYKKARPLPRPRLNKQRDSALEERLRVKWELENWATQVKLSPQYGATFGDSYKRVIPGQLQGDPKAPSRIAVHSPEIMTVLRDQHHHHRILAAKIEYMYSEPRDIQAQMQGSGFTGGLSTYLPAMYDTSYVGLNSTEELHKYTMIVTEEAYYTFRDHVQYPYDGNPTLRGMEGNRPLNSWKNDLGVVPVIPSPFDDIGEDMGLSTFDTVIPMLDALNELATMFGQILKMHADPPLVAFNINPNSKFEKVLNSDGSTVWYLPMPPMFGQTNALQPKLEYLEWKGSSAGPLLDFIKMAHSAVRAALPESLYQTGQGDSSGGEGGSGYERQLRLQPLVDKIEEIREGEFASTEAALQLAFVADDAGAKGEQLDPEEALERIEAAKQEYDLFIWSEPVLPRDRATEEQITSTALANKVISRREARLNRGMTYIEADEMEKQVEDDFQTELEHAKALAEVEAEVAARFAPKPAVGQNMGIRPKGSQKGAGGRATSPTKPQDRNLFNNPKGGQQPNASPGNPNDNN